MSYDPNNMSALSYANGFTLWHYRTPDNSRAVDIDGYFNDASAMLRAGDFIMANASQSVMLVVRSNDGAMVRTAILAEPQDPPQ